MREQLSRFRPGPTLKAGAVFVAFLLVFLLIDRTLGAGGATPDPQAGQPTTSAQTAPESTAAPTTTQAPTTTTAPTTTAAPTTTQAPTTAAPESTRPPQQREEQPPEEDTTTQPPLRSAEGVTLQVLNGTGELRLARDFKPIARTEGYDIVNSGNANGDFPVSTIFYTPGHRPDAESFKRRFPAFEVVAPAPDNLSDDVALHAVLGKNYHP